MPNRQGEPRRKSHYQYHYTSQENPPEASSVKQTRPPARSTHILPHRTNPETNSRPPGNRPCNLPGLGKCPLAYRLGGTNRATGHLAGIRPLHGPGCLFPGTPVAVARSGDRWTLASDPLLRPEWHPNTGYPLYVALGIMHSSIRGEDSAGSPSFGWTGWMRSSVALGGWSSMALSEAPLQRHGWAPLSGHVPSSRDGRDVESLYRSTAGRLNHSPPHCRSMSSETAGRTAQATEPGTMTPAPGPRAPKTWAFWTTLDVQTLGDSSPEKLASTKKERNSDETRLSWRLAPGLMLGKARTE